MKLVVIKNAVTSKVARQALIGKKHSPTIMFVGGVVGVVGTVVLACRATMQIEDVLDEADKSHSNAQTKRDHAIATSVAVIELGKLYAPAVGLGVVSIAALTGSHVALTRRNVALTAAYKTVEEAFDRYRERVIEDAGKEKDLEYYRGVKEVEVHDTKTGKVQKHRVQVNGGSMYGKFFDENNRNWSPDPSYNFIFLKAQQNYANDRLQAKGHLFLNEVYDDLGIERTSAGAVVGWIKDSPKGDNCIDFGIFDDKNPNKFYDFITGQEGLWLDFNVDGTIWDKI